MDKLVYVLEKIKSINDKYDEIDKINGVNFNIFSILNMERKEVKTHSNFIYELLNPNGLHSKGDVFLKLFFEKVLKLEYDTDTKLAPVIQEDITSENKRIDFTIQTNNYQIGIEMKIDAEDQSHQLYDYYYELVSRIKNKQSVKLYYLTLDGKEPSDKSIIKSSNKIKIEDKYLISFENDITSWLEECVKESAINTPIREAIIQYLNLVNKITNKSNSKGRKMEISNLFSDGENLKIFLQAEKNILDAKVNLQLKFWKKLKKALSNHGLQFEYYFNIKASKIDIAVEKYYNNSKMNKDYGLELYMDEDIRVFIDIYNRLFYNIHTSNKNVIDNLDDWEESDDCNYYRFSTEALNFSNLLETERIFDILDDENSNIISGIVKDIELIKINIEKSIK